LLPFLKKKPVAGLIIKTRESDKPEQENEQLNSEEALKACASDLIDAVHNRDIKAAADAMRAAFECLESEPHEENSNDYDSLNEKAAEQEES
jgi:hypothetical protein